MSTGTVWGLDTGRPGEFKQVEILGTALGLDFQRIRLSPENAPPPVLPAEPPRLILSFGRASRAALRLADACAAKGGARPLRVHLGTPGQIPITEFDLIIPMPQDDYPAAPNVHFLRLPLNSADAAAPPAPAAGGRCTVIIGGPSRHFRLPVRAIRRLIRFGGRLAAANGEALHIVTSPRTPAPVLAGLHHSRIDAGFTLHKYGSADFTELLRAGSRFVVTGDSASMLADACRTGAPVWLFPLPARPNLSDVLQNAVDRCFGRAFRHRLVRRGLVGGGTDFRRWHAELTRTGRIAMVSSRHQHARHKQDAALRWTPQNPAPDTDLADCRTRILGMLAQSSPLPFGGDSVSR
jgi:mitochondrial fission protein ELM1